MGALPYFKLYAGDWTLGTLSLTLAERGAYISLLAWSWENGPLPKDEGPRAQILSISVAELRKLWPALSPFWREGATGYTNKRLEAERTGAKKRSREMTKAANERWRRAKADANA